MQARVEQLEAEGRQKDEDLRDSENEVARISSELFESRTQNNESKQILVRHEPHMSIDLPYVMSTVQLYPSVELTVCLCPDPSNQGCGGAQGPSARV